MEILKVNVLGGPNRWAAFPVLELWLDLGEWKDLSSEMVPGFNDRLISWLPTLVEHRCSVGTRGGFLERLRRGTYLAHTLEHVTLELQSLAGVDVGFGRARETCREGVYRVAIEFEEETLARAALETGRQLLTAAMRGEDYDVPAAVAGLRELAQDVCMGPSTRSIVEAAKARNIPVRRLTRGSMVRLGHGCRQRKICAAETDSTSALAEAIAQDKDLTRRLLTEVGLPVPEGRPVKSPQEAREEAGDIGLPVVVKPRYGNQGKGVVVNVRTLDQVEAAYAIAEHNSPPDDPGILVEKHIEGDDYRFLVVGKKVIAAAHRESARVIGDGRQTIAQLLEEVNADPRRGVGHASILTRLKLDEVSLAVLAEQGLDAGSIPAPGQVALIRRNANLSTGGTARDVTDEVHPEFAHRMVEAARVVGLDVAGIDVVARDVRRPLDAENGAIIEINAAPGLRMHLSPSEGQARPAGAAIVELLFPEEGPSPGRIPIVSVTGVNGKTTVTRLIAHLIAWKGGNERRTVGMTCTDGIWIGQRRIDSDDCSGPRSAKAVLAHPDVEAAVLETARGGILREGLGFDICDVAVVTNIGGGDHLGLAEIHTVEDLAAVKRTIVEAVSPRGYAVLNATDPLVLAMAEKCPGHVALFAVDPLCPPLVEHVKTGGVAVTVIDGIITVLKGESEWRLVPVPDVPLTLGGCAPFQVENVLAAAVAGWCLGLPREALRSGLTSFQPNLSQSPCRFNVVSVDKASVVIDYGHNPSSLKAVVGALEGLAGHRRLAVYSTAGDRRDEDIVRQGELLALHFDHVILYEGHYLRGRRKGETLELFRRGITSAGDAARVAAVTENVGALEAVHAGLDMLKPGDVLLLQADQVDETARWFDEWLERRRQSDIRELVSAEAPCSDPADSPSLFLCEEGAETPVLTSAP